MTQERIEQVRQAIVNKVVPLSKKAEYARIFECGVAWADENPVNPLISVNDQLPPEFKPVIVIFDNGIVINAFVTMVKDEPAWHPSVEIPIGSDVLFWMNMPELPKMED